MSKIESREGRVVAEIVLNDGEVVDVPGVGSESEYEVAEAMAHSINQGSVWVDDPETLVIPSSSIKYVRIPKESN